MTAPVEVLLPLKLGSGLNMREHWRKRAKRVRIERNTTFHTVPDFPVPCVVTITRHSAGVLDSDNLQGAAKSVRDAIADRLCVNDNDPRVEWRYAQKKCRRGEYGVTVQLEVV